MELQEQLKEEAIALGACEEGIASWGEPGINELCEKYFKYEDFCIQHDWPSVDLLSELNDPAIGENGIFVNTHGSCVSKQNMAFLRGSKMIVLVKCPCSITVRHNAEVEIRLEVGELCYISMHDDCKVKIVSKQPKGRIAVSYWSGTIENKEMVDKIYKKEK